MPKLVLFEQLTLNTLKDLSFIYHETVPLKVHKRENF
jgi:hypothetical protein